MKEIYHAKIMTLLKKNDWLSAGVEIVKLYELYPLDREIKDTCSLIFGIMLHEHPNFQPSSSEEFMWRGIVCRQKRNIFDTLRDLGEACRLNPQNHHALKWKAEILLSFGAKQLFGKAKVDLEKAISICPLSEYYTDLAKIYTKEDDHESALFYNLKSIERFTDTEPGWEVKKGYYYYYSGKSYWNLNQYQEAKIMFNKTLELLPGHFTAEHYLDRINQFQHTD